PTPKPWPIDFFPVKNLSSTSVKVVRPTPKPWPIDLFSADGLLSTSAKVIKPTPRPWPADAPLKHSSSTLVVFIKPTPKPWPVNVPAPDPDNDLPIRADLDEPLPTPEVSKPTLESLPINEISEIIYEDGDPNEEDFIAPSFTHLWEPLETLSPSVDPPNLLDSKGAFVSPGTIDKENVDISDIPNWYNWELVDDYGLPDTFADDTVLTSSFEEENSNLPPSFNPVIIEDYFPGKGPRVPGQLKTLDWVMFDPAAKRVHAAPVKPDSTISEDRVPGTTPNLPVAFNPLDWDPEPTSPKAFIGSTPVVPAQGVWNTEGKIDNFPSALPLPKSSKTDTDLEDPTANLPVLNGLLSKLSRPSRPLDENTAIVPPHLQPSTAFPLPLPTSSALNLWDTLGDNLQGQLLALASNLPEPLSEYAAAEPVVPVPDPAGVDLPLTPGLEKADTSQAIGGVLGFLDENTRDKLFDLLAPATATVASVAGRQQVPGDANDALPSGEPNLADVTDIPLYGPVSSNYPVSIGGVENNIILDEADWIDKSPYVLEPSSSTVLNIPSIDPLDKTDAPTITIPNGPTSVDETAAPLASNLPLTEPFEETDTTQAISNILGSLDKETVDYLANLLKTAVDDTEAVPATQDDPYTDEKPWSWEELPFDDGDEEDTASAATEATVVDATKRARKRSSRQANSWEQLSSHLKPSTKSYLDSLIEELPPLASKFGSLITKGIPLETLNNIQSAVGVIAEQKSYAIPESDRAALIDYMTDSKSMGFSMTSLGQLLFTAKVAPALSDLIIKAGAYSEVVPKDRTEKGRGEVMDALKAVWTQLAEPDDSTEAADTKKRGINSSGLKLKARQSSPVDVQDAKDFIEQQLYTLCPSLENDTNPTTELIANLEDPTADFQTSLARFQNALKAYTAKLDACSFKVKAYAVKLKALADPEYLKEHGVEAEAARTKRQEVTGNTAFDDYLKQKDGTTLAKWQYGILSKEEREELFKKTEEAKKAAASAAAVPEAHVALPNPPPRLPSPSPLNTPLSGPEVNVPVSPADPNVLLAQYQDVIKKIEDLLETLKTSNSVSTPSISSSSVSILANGPFEAPIKSTVESVSLVSSPALPTSLDTTGPISIHSTPEELNLPTDSASIPDPIDSDELLSITKNRVRRHAREFNSPKGDKSKSSIPAEILGKHGTLDPYGMLGPQIPEEEAKEDSDSKATSNSTLKKLPDSSDEDYKWSYEDLDDSSTSTTSPELEKIPTLDPFGQLGPQVPGSGDDAEDDTPTYKDFIPDDEEPGPEDFTPSTSDTDDQMEESSEDAPSPELANIPQLDPFGQLGPQVPDPTKSNTSAENKTDHAPSFDGLDEKSESDPSPELANIPPLDPFGQLGPQVAAKGSKTRLDDPPTDDESIIDFIEELAESRKGPDPRVYEDDGDNDEVSYFGDDDFGDEGGLGLPFLSQIKKGKKEKEKDGYGISRHADEDAEMWED
ncbi:hypothetical protein P280DRAFT_280800, partial [Massarina eburnea CBS 473.64]